MDRKEKAARNPAKPAATETLKLTAVHAPEYDRPASRIFSEYHLMTETAAFPKRPDTAQQKAPSAKGLALHYS